MNNGLDLSTLFLFPTITGIVGGVGTVVVTKMLEQKNIFGSRKDFRNFNGVWYGLHLTADPITGKLVYSNHEYKLDVSRSGIIKGLSKDLLTLPPTNWTVRGNVFDGGLALLSQENLETDLYSTELYSFNKFSFDPKNDKASLVGTLNGWDYHSRSKFVAIIILSRTIIREDEFTKMLQGTSTTLYDRSSLKQNISIKP